MIRREDPVSGVARVVLARPETRNAQSPELLYQLDAALTDAAADTSRGTARSPTRRVPRPSVRNPAANATDYLPRHAVTRVDRKPRAGRFGLTGRLGYWPCTAFPKGGQGGTETAEFWPLSQGEIDCTRVKSHHPFGDSLVGPPISALWASLASN